LTPDFTLRFIAPNPILYEKYKLPQTTTHVAYCIPLLEEEIVLLSKLMDYPITEFPSLNLILFHELENKKHTANKGPGKKSIKAMRKWIKKDMLSIRTRFTFPFCFTFSTKPHLVRTG
jgi:hypothetical protein